MTEAEWLAQTDPQNLLAFLTRSHAPRGNARPDALRPLRAKCWRRYQSVLTGNKPGKPA
jgi:hypothetical protein